MLTATTYVAAVTGLQWRVWSQEQSAAIFVPSSGRTHLVSLLAFVLLEQCSVQSHSLAQLIDFVLGHETGNDEEKERVIEAAQGLIQAGLLHTVQCR